MRIRILHFAVLILLAGLVSQAYAQVSTLPLPPSSAGGFPQPPGIQQQQIAPPALPAPIPLPNQTTTGGTGAISQQIQEQSQGLYPILERNPTLPLGSLQRAWDVPYASSGQIAPGIIRFVWRPDLVMAVRSREFMVTTLHLPDFEKVNSIVVGDPVIFEVQQIKQNVIGLRPTHAGADSNITVLGASGNVYSFYVRSEGFNSDQVSDITVYVEANRPLAATSFSPGGGASGQKSSSISTSVDSYASTLSTELAGTPGFIPSYIQEIAFNPENLSFDMTILAPTPEDAEIAPLRVFNDGVWTYFDFGDKVDSMRRPVVYLVLDEVDTLVNTRTAGPKGNLLVAEAVGDFTLRNGNRVICVYRQQTLAKRRGEDASTFGDAFTVNKDQLIISPGAQPAPTEDLNEVSTWFE